MWLYYLGRRDYLYITVVLLRVISCICKIIIGSISMKFFFTDELMISVHEVEGETVSCIS
jgi:hypothetical protein